MSNFTQMEFNTIREMVTSHQTAAKKLNDYSVQCTDPQIKQMFEQSACEAKKSAQNLIDML